MAASIQEFGFRQPIVVDEDNVILVGHTRLAAAQQLGLDQIPVHFAKGLSEAQKKAYRLMDNRSAEIAKWDWDLLPLEVGELETLDFDLSLTGFSEDELSAMMGRIEPGDEGDQSTLDKTKPHVCPECGFNF